MKLPTASEALFSLKSFTAAMLALYLALRIGLPRPFWAMLTAYIVAQPLSGSVRSKAAYRVVGTILGSAAAVFLVPRLANSPELLTLALASWVALCLYVSLLDRTPRAYLFMLAGYTVGLIGFPAVTDPASVFDVAVARVEEIILGIVCATLVHSLVLPQSVGPVLLARLDHAIDDAQRWMRDALGRGSGEKMTQDRRKLAGDITELRLMTTHLPFDTSHLRWTSRAIRAFQDRLAMMVPLLSAVEDRLHALQELDPESLSPQWRTMLSDIAEWGEGGAGDPYEQAAAIRSAIAGLTPVIRRDASWTEILKVNLAARLRALVDAGEDCYKFRRRIDAVLHRAVADEVRERTGTTTRVLHRDYRLALMSAVAAMAGIVATCAFWIATAWPQGWAAAMMAAVFCSFFAAQDDPVPNIRLYLNYTLLSIPISAVYLLAVLPALHSFQMLVMATAPLFLVLGVYVARPTTTLRAMAVLFGVAGTLSLQDTGTADLVSFINITLAQIAGIGAAALITKLMRSVDADWTVRRLLRAVWTELARFAEAGRAPPIAAVLARMVDRIALLTPRLAMAGEQQDLAAVDALSDMRIGLNMAHLLHIRSRLEHDGVPLQPLLHDLSTYFRNRPFPAAATAPMLLDHTDHALRAVCAVPPTAEQYAAVAALAGIRRDLFPNAPRYQPAEETP
ncbi:MAG: hypothetical protein V7606_1530 [Burkholderiales bacterium]